MCHYWHVSQYPWKYVNEFHNSVDDSPEIRNVESSMKLSMQVPKSEVTHLSIYPTGLLCKQTFLFLFFVWGET